MELVLDCVQCRIRRWEQPWPSTRIPGGRKRFTATRGTMTGCNAYKGYCADHIFCGEEDSRRLPFVGLRNAFWGYDHPLLAGGDEVLSHSLAEIWPLYPLPGDVNKLATTYYTHWMFSEELAEDCYQKSDSWSEYPLDTMTVNTAIADHVTTERVLLPRHCPPEKRAAAFVNSYAPAGKCGAAFELVQAIALACEVTGAGDPSSVSGTPPQHHDVGGTPLPTVPGCVVSRCGRRKS